MPFQTALVCVFKAADFFAVDGNETTLMDPAQGYFSACNQTSGDGYYAIQVIHINQPIDQSTNQSIVVAASRYNPCSGA